jgi:hypothetical protein
MQVTRKATGVTVAAALTISCVFGGASAATASPVAPSEFVEVAGATASVAEGDRDSMRGEELGSVDRETRAAVAVIPVITAVILAGGAAYAMGQKAAERLYYMGLRNPQWQRVKWQVRTTALGMLGPVGGPIFMTGFENKFYSMV